MPLKVLRLDRAFELLCRKCIEHLIFSNCSTSGQVDTKFQIMQIGSRWGSPFTSMATFDGQKATDGGAQIGYSMD